MASFTPATELLQVLERVVEQDQGAAYRTNLQKVLPHIGDAYRGADEGFRSHLGASVIGNECPRAIWYGFRWFTKPHFGGRIMRLFNRGHLEEGRFIALLLTAGIQIYQQDENGNQFRISDVGGHFGGSGDGVAIGVPGVQADLPVLLEFKTHNDKSFQKLKKEGVRVAKFEHYVQMTIYMQKMGLAVALYMAVNKNDDEIWAEFVSASSPLADQMIDRGRKIILMRKAPEKINNSAGWFQCSWCDHKPVCHLKGAPAVNCRTCISSIAKEDGNWYCEHDTEEVLTKERQLAGCGRYEAIK